jgi:hypothetical protein
MSVLVRLFDVLHSKLERVVLIPPSGKRFMTIVQRRLRSQLACAQPEEVLGTSLHEFLDP